LASHRGEISTASGELSERPFSYRSEHERPFILRGRYSTLGAHGLDDRRDDLAEIRSRRPLNPPSRRT
jgi:hypothetical protein